MLKKVWNENKRAVLARSRRAYDDIEKAVNEGNTELAFAQLTRAYRQPIKNWHNAALHLWEELQESFPNDYPELEKMLTEVSSTNASSTARDDVKLWLWRRVVKSGNQALLADRFFADDFLFYRSLQEEQLVCWYGARQAQWPIQLLLGLFLGSSEKTKRLRLQLYWPTAKLPENFQASRLENRVLRRLWEARILVRFGSWAHLHPLIMLLLPEISSFSSPVMRWKDRQLIAHMSDGRVWPIAPFSLAALVFDESLALFQRDRRSLWKNFTTYASSYLEHPDDVASNFALQYFDEIELGAMNEANRNYLREFAEGVQFLETLKASI